MTGQRKPAAISASAMPACPLGSRAVRLAEADAVAFGVMDDAGLGDVGGEVGQRSDDAPRLDGRGDDAARIDALEAQPVELAAVLLEVPPRNAVLRADDDRVRAEERTQLRRQRGQAVRLDAEEDDVGLCRSSARSPVTCGCTSKSPSGLVDAQAALLHRPQMRPAREQHDVRARARQPRADVAADRAGAGDDDSHERLRRERLRHDAPLDLAGGRARNRVGDVNLLRTLEVGQPLLAEGQQVGFASRRRRAQDDGRRDFFAPGRVRHAEAHRFGDRRMRRAAPRRSRAARSSRRRD